MKKIIFGSIDGMRKDSSDGKNLCLVVKTSFIDIGKAYALKEFENMGIKDKRISFTISYSDKKVIFPIKGEFEGNIFYAVGISNSYDEARAMARKSLFNKVGVAIAYSQVQIETKNIK